MQRVFSTHIWESNIGKTNDLNNGIIHTLSSFDHETNIQQTNFDFGDIRTSILRVPVENIDENVTNIPFIEALYIEPPKSVELYQEDPIVLLFPHGGPHATRFVCHLLILYVF